MALSAVNSALQHEISRLQLELNIPGYASKDVDEQNYGADALYEGMFLRGFTAYEAALEKIFVHYVIGGSSTQGHQPQSRITHCTEVEARAILKSDGKYIDWSSVSVVRARSQRFFVGGEPFATVLGLQSDKLSEVEKIRNRIAHDSAEALASFKDVERARFSTERVFKMRPGQLLRTRRKGAPPLSVCAELLSVLATTVLTLSNRV